VCTDTADEVKSYASNPKPSETVDVIFLSKILLTERQNSIILSSRRAQSSLELFPTRLARIIQRSNGNKSQIYQLAAKRKPFFKLSNVSRFVVVTFLHTHTANGQRARYFQHRIAYRKFVAPTHLVRFFRFCSFASGLRESLRREKKTCLGAATGTRFLFIGVLYDVRFLEDARPINRELLQSVSY